MPLHMCFALQSASALTTAVRAARAHGPLLGALAAVGDRAPFPTAVRDALAHRARGAFAAALLVAALSSPVRKALAGRERALGAARVVTPLACAPSFAPREQRVADGGSEGVASRREKDVPVASSLDRGVCGGGVKML